MSLHREDREFQIRLAELQADVQIYTTASFTVLAVLLATVIGFEQIYFSLPKEEILQKNIALATIIVSGILCFWGVRFLLTKAFEARKQMEELKKQYVW